MTRSLTSPSAGSTVVGVLQPYEGGTGQTTAAAVRSSLGLAASSDFNVANGIAVLGSDGKLVPANIPDDGPSSIGLKGTTSVVVNGSLSFEITNYDVFTTYNISATGGVVRRNGNTVFFTAGSVAGTYALVINGRSVNVVVDAIQPNSPVLTAVDIGSGLSNAALSATGSAFSMNQGTNTHLNSDWQIATDIGFGNIVAASMADATNKTTWTSGALNLSTTYYARVRYRDASNGVSNWSNVVVINTKSTYALGAEEAILVASDKTANVQLGKAVAISSDGSRVVVSTYFFNNSQGKVYIFTRIGTSWAQEASFVAGDPQANAAFGYSVSMTSDGSRVVIGANAFTGTLNAQGKIYVFLRTGTTWTQEAALIASDPLANAQFGWSVSISSDGSRVAVGAYTFTGTQSNQGKIYVFLRTGTTWTQEAALIASDPSSGATLGNSISISSDGLRIAAGANAFNSAQGKIYIFSRSGTTWTQEAGFQASDPSISSQLGYSVSISADGSRVVSGAYARNSSYTGQGKVYIFLRTGTAWAQETAFLASDPTVSANFGFSVSISADGSRVAIGAIGFTGTQTNQGKVYIFLRTGTTWAQESGITTSNAAANDGFGWSVAISGDGLRVVGCSYAADPGGTSNAGAAYVYH